MPAHPSPLEGELPEGGTISFDTDLPIAAHADEIAGLIEHHQVVVVAGETGSGKTTQLPKICLALGRRHIAHTQPRRIAARSVADRIADEMGVEIGNQVGFQVRFTRRATRETALTVMTDGVLLAEISHDRELRAHDTIIIDEAHERSLNIDFLLGYLKQLLPRRPDLKIIITSATIDTARFSAHFDDAPVIEVSGRSYPVEMRYRPLDPAEELDAESDAGEGDDDHGVTLAADPIDQTTGICRAVQELTREGPGDILVFLAGERDIRDAADALTDLKLRDTEILPLFARLSAAEQHRVFTRHPGRRIVLATNVAETSLTVPGIRYVIDPGTARISRYSARTRVQRLPIEPVSQASANQRAGRCGRVAPGICIRLYSQRDFDSRPEFTEPEILRTNLAAVILQMAQARLGAITDFPFVEAPDHSQVADGIRLLDELGALKPGHREEPRLTRIGHQLATMPVDPRLGRMILEGARQHSLDEVLVIVAALSIPDVKERPADKREQADAYHHRFLTETGLQRAIHPEAADQPEVGGPADQGGDIMAIHRLWRYLHHQRKALSGSAFRRMCHREFLNFLRVREWQDLHSQLKQICKELKLERNTSAAPPDRVLVALLSGLLSHIGLAEVVEKKKGRNGGGRRGSRSGPREYLGARGAKFAINPGSALAKHPPELVMAVELVETSRLWARTVAGVQPEWVEEVGAHLLKRQYSEPHWAQSTASVVATERATLFGVPIWADRLVNYARIDPVVSREIFIRSALVERDWRAQHGFLVHNDRVRQEAEDLEERSRQRGLVADDEAIFAFYDRRIPSEIVSANHFNAWWRQVEDRHQLDLSPRRSRRSRCRRWRRFPRPLAGRGALAAGALRLRPGIRPRRRHRHHPAGPAQPGPHRPVQLAGPRAAHRPGHRAHPLAAQGDPHPAGARPRPRPAGPRLAGKPRRRRAAQGRPHRPLHRRARPGPHRADRRPHRRRRLAPRGHSGPPESRLRHRRRRRASHRPGRRGWTQEFQEPAEAEEDRPAPPDRPLRGPLRAARRAGAQGFAVAHPGGR
jgi:ATP-dependent helicase HrpA